MSRQAANCILVCWELVCFSLRIQVCPKKGIIPTYLFQGWEWNPQSYPREGSGFLGSVLFSGFCCGCWFFPFRISKSPKKRPRPFLGQFFWAGFSVNPPHVNDPPFFPEKGITTVSGRKFMATKSEKSEKSQFGTSHF